MKLYLDCSMGAAGDMLMAALYELLPDKGAFGRKMASLGIPGVEIKYEKSVKCGISGTHIKVIINGEVEESLDVGAHSHGHDHDHHHHDHADGGHSHSHEAPHGATRGHREISELISELDLPENVKNDALAVYEIIAQAEAEVHNTDRGSVHFHEVGSLDAVVDIVGCCLAKNMLGVTEVHASAVHVGTGFVKASHGILPVPAPATANILRGVPIYGGRVKGELCTPTGAALLKKFVSNFGHMNVMTAEKIGYGMGTKDFDTANCLRAYLCAPSDADDSAEEILGIECNLDDMTPEAIGAAVDVLLEACALDVFTTPVYMKKGRPAVALTCLCKLDDREKLSTLMLRHTTTLGVRITNYRRDVLSRNFRTVTTKYGQIQIKTATGLGIHKTKPEYDDVAAAAKRAGVSFNEVYIEALRLAAEIF